MTADNPTPSQPPKGIEELRQKVERWIASSNMINDKVDEIIALFAAQQEALLDKLHAYMYTDAFGERVVSWKHLEATLKPHNGGDDE